MPKTATARTPGNRGDGHAFVSEIVLAPGEDEVSSSEIAAFLKWAGGKRWLVNRHRGLFPQGFKRYFEPFVGSGAVFFRLRPTRGLLSDTNMELINLYKAMKTAPDCLFACLQRHSENHDTPYYYKIRSTAPNDRIERAARTLYLNRTCWNGLYRVNRKGAFNVPRGTKDSVIFPDDDFIALSKALRRIRIRCCDFEESIDETKEGDFLFVDPPYTVRHNNNGFLKYNEAIFTWEDQVRLAACIKRAKSRGVMILVTNACHSSVCELYKPIGSVRRLPRQSIISGPVPGRRQTSEMAVQINYATI